MVPMVFPKCISDELGFLHESLKWNDFSSKKLWIFLYGLLIGAEANALLRGKANANPL